VKRALPDADTVKAAIDMVLEEAVTRGRRPTVTAIERRLAIPHATFHRHYADLIDTHFRPRIPAARAETHTDRPKADETKEENLHRLFQVACVASLRRACTAGDPGSAVIRTTSWSSSGTSRTSQFNRS
jgi:hypothetical protein